MSFKVFIQARMSSNRLPGKILMPFNGKPIIRNVVDAAGVDRAVVLTSTLESDDPLVSYLEKEGIEYFRGSLDDVYGRFCGAIEQLRPEWVMRICADSPLIPAVLLDAMIEIERGDADIVTNVHPKSFPKGHSVEIIRAQTMMDIDKNNLTDADKEHVTPYFYRNAQQFKIISVTQKPNMNDQDLAVDTPDDYDRLRRLNGTSVNYNPENWKIS